MTQDLDVGRLIGSLLPVQSLRTLCCALADCWRDQLGAEAVTIVVRLPGANRAWGGAAVRDRQTVFTEFDAPARESELEQSRRVLGSEVAISISEMSPISVPIEYKGKSLGSVVVYFRSTVPQPAVSQLAAISATLVRQGLLVEGFADPENPTLTPNAAHLEALAEFAAGAGHEINNPLATIIGRAQLLMKGETNPQRLHMLRTIGGQAYRIRDMIGDVMLFGRPPPPNPNRCDLTASVREVIRVLGDLASDRDCNIELKAGDTVPIWADATQLSVVISSLVRNSIEAVASGGRIVVETSACSYADVPHGLLTVSDNGPGLDAASRVHLFDPFFSGRQAGRGLGFGLPKAWRIITLHGGSVEVDAGSTEGLCFRVYWPAAPRPA